MRNFIDIITEATKPTKTGTRDKTEFDFMPSLEPGGAVATAGATKKDVASKIPGKRARHRLKAIDLGDPEIGAQASRHLSSLNRSGIEDVIDDDEARRRSDVGDADIEQTDGAEPTPPNIENLPAIINKEVATTGGRNVVNPEWHQIKNLPGYFRSMIRAVGRQIFGQFTDTPLEDLQVITDMNGINPPRDVQGMMAWIMKNGVRDHDAHIDFEAIMPGYSADYSLWKTAEYTFLIVKDFGGHYIYGWTGGRGVHVGGRPEPKMIEGVVPKKKGLRNWIR